MKKQKENRKLFTEAELSDLFWYAAQLARMVSPAAAKEYYNFTFDGAVADTLQAISVMYENAENNYYICRDVEQLKEDGCYGPTLSQIFKDIKQYLGE